MTTFATKSDPLKVPPVPPRVVGALLLSMLRVRVVEGAATVTRESDGHWTVSTSTTSAKHWRNEEAWRLYLGAALVKIHNDDKEEVSA